MVKANVIRLLLENQNLAFMLANSRLTIPLLLISMLSLGHTEERPVEIHDRIAKSAPSDKRFALILDICSGKFEDKLINFLVSNKFLATLFATQNW